ncbi:MFS transporter [Oceaniglobus ichthyenteri]|uniref:MFS transporter n=1 Tax=Oceaniglobus ichthyenteri TaxID=2136177 RepID=UPI000D3D187E|nr:MFS transporter [Oceaniglobus ichthyenteri]
MADISNRKKIWGWFFFDWASQPYNTLLLTFIFGPYINEILGDGTAAQSAWGFGIGAAGILIALMAPVLGALADTSGRRLPWIWVFSGFYVVGAGGLWFAAPDDFNLITTMMFFAVGLIGMEFATIFTNSILPELGPKERLGRISGNGWAFGYVGGLVTLVIMLVFFAESGATGKTFAGFTPPFGLDPDAREGTRFVGPLTAIWFAVFMIPFFLWVREPRRPPAPPGAVMLALRGLKGTLRALPRTPSLFAYLASSMFYRDALNGIYTFGGIYAAGVMGWSVVDTGMFGILAIVAGAVFAFVGGWADSAFGPKPVIVLCILVLIVMAITVVTITPLTVLWITVAPESNLPDQAFLAVGVGIGAAGGALQSASRTMLVRQANPARMTEAFGLFALAGKATSFMAPLAIGAATYFSGSQQIGVSPLIGLFALGLVLLLWVKPDGDRAV